MQREKQPTDYTSPSGEYVLCVDPDDRFGAGPGSYRLTRRSEEVWSGRRDFTLWDARVADDGTVAGYAYGAGYEGWPRDGNDFRAIILDARGAERLNDSEPRQPVFHQPASPAVAGLFIDADGDRFVLRILDPDVNRGLEEWRVYRLSVGEPVGRYQPRQAYPERSRGLGIFAAEPIRGTPLTLINWWDFHDGTINAKFSLVDPETRPVWELDLPGDYHGSGEAWDALWRELRRGGAILDTQSPRSFELRFAAPNQRVRFEVARGGIRGWKVTESSRTEYRPGSDAPSPEPEIPEEELELLRKFELRSPGDAVGPIRNVGPLMAVGPDRLAFVRDAYSGEATLCVVDYQGNVLHTLPLQQAWVQEEKDRSHIAWAGGDRFYVVRSAYTYAEDANATAWIADAAAGTLTELPKLNCPYVTAIAALRGGGFVLLINDVHRHTSTPGLFAFDGSGRLLWKNYDPRGHSANDPPGKLFSPKAITVTSSNEVAVLDVVRKSIQFFSAAGAHLRTWPLEILWGRMPNYPTHLAAASNGGILVYDFNAPLAVVAMDDTGEVLRQLKPHFPDQRIIEPRDGVICDAADRLWATDGHALLRLDQSGTVVQTLGSPPSTSVLTQVESVTIGPHGRFYAADHRTHAVHLFSSDGKWQMAFSPLPTDFGGLNLNVELTVAQNGEVYLTGAKGGDLRFSPSGERLGVQAEPGASPSSAPASEAVRWRGLSLLDAEGREIIRVQRRADGFWIDRMAKCCAAPDGSLAVLDAAIREDGETAAAVTLFAPDGEVRNTFRLPRAIGRCFHVAFDGCRVAVSNGPTVALFSVDGQPQFTVTPPAERREKAWWIPFLSDRGRRLSLFDGERTVYQYALP